MRTAVALSLTLLAMAFTMATIHENNPDGAKFETLQTDKDYDNCTPCRARLITPTQQKELAKLRERIDV